MSRISRFKKFKMLVILLIGSIFIYYSIYISIYLKIKFYGVISYTRPIYFSNYISSCGPRGDSRGVGQKVISYSLYEGENLKHFEHYKHGIHLNLQSMRDVYKSNWTMRIYSDLKETREITEIIRNNPSLDWCNVSQLFPDIYMDMNPMVWRFFPLGDPLVDIFLSRDLDGELTLREAKAVNEWLKSNFTFHTMRDHIWHTHYIMGGLWGAKLHQIKSQEALQILENCILAGKENDQDILSRFLWAPYAPQNEILSHDSYHCRWFGHSVPWPSRRVGRDFVGQEVVRYGHYGIKLKHKCPLACRPKHGLHWSWC